MTLICAFAFYGPSVAKGRPRARSFKVGEQTRTQIYTPARTASFEGKVRAVAAVAMSQQGAEPTPDAVHVELAFEKAMPVSWSNKKRLAFRGEPISQAPDIDNQVKAVLDALNGVVWEDDKQVSDLTTSRRWGETDSFRISISLASGPGVLSEVA